ncbi:competence type IV pilus minor pilin ComGD [Bacillus sp. HMF5848]|uniref:competence type IV pilus minor pilin ComGD n=1 Tax=Bacillus sp. HMF5848 TaxID=2495421 RepID=UPI00163A5D2A|nr:competence type IV pilus minor pilin ComGD [Bacillus sp. HMF5848]
MNRLTKARKLLTNEDAYTLIEMLIVLSIISVLLTVSFFHITPVVSTRTINNMIEVLKSDILFSEQYAISHNEYVTLTINDPKKLYMIQTGGLFSGKSTIRRYDSNITIQTLNYGNTIRINGNGNIVKSGSIKIMSKNNIYRFVFLMGRGRFYVEKLEP